MVIKTNKGFIAICSSKKRNTASLIDFAKQIAKKYHNTNNFFILSL